MLKPPNLKNATLWRYISFPALLDMFLNKRIHFSSPLSFRDPWEGYNSEKQRLKWIKFWSRKDPISDHLIRAFFNCVKRNTFICCWHKNKRESEAMWNKYSENHSIAIIVKSENVERLFPSLADIHNAIFDDKKPGIEFHYCINDVQYVNETRNPWILEPYEVFFYKRGSFSYENEVRSLIFDYKKNREDFSKLREITKDSPEHLNQYFEKRIEPEGMFLDIKPNQFISKILIHPQAPKWIVAVIEETMKRVGFKKRIEKSTLFEPPPFA